MGSEGRSLAARPSTRTAPAGETRNGDGRREGEEGRRGKGSYEDHRTQRGTSACVGVPACGIRLSLPFGRDCNRDMYEQKEIFNVVATTEPRDAGESVQSRSERYERVKSKITNNSSLLATRTTAAAAMLLLKENPTDGSSTNNPLFLGITPFFFLQRRLPKNQSHVMV